MADGSTKGAVHLTDLSLDLTTFHENIRQIEEATAEAADISVQNLAKIREALNIPNEQFSFSVDTENFASAMNEAKNAMHGFEQSSQKAAQNVSGLGESFKKAAKGQEEFIVRSKDAKSLARAYETIQVKIAGIISALTASKVKDTGMQDLIAKAKEVEQEIANTANEIKETGNITEDSYKAFYDFKSVINEISIAFSHFKTGSNEYKKSLEPIETQTKQTISALKTLEKSATFDTSKKQVAALRAEYEEFLNKLKNTSIGTDAAQAELDELNAKFTQLEGTVKRGHTWLENWVNKITESAKWQIANSALNLLQQSFGNLTGTIIETENSVIELQRVLNDKQLADSAISDELYNIAYEFGQTFDAVQDVAVRFAQTGLGWQETVDATRATMLGLNTAELEVSSATEGLIAVMAQFGLEASDLEAVIDKINITADNFPVTSEKIVAALQRAGGTANAFGLSLEETIGVITALGEATGRAGEAIGTAMNSLIAFSMKDSALEKFSDFLGKDVSDYNVLDLWQELSEAIKGGNTELSTMMSQSEEFADMMDETLASSVGLEEEYNLALKEQNEALKDGKDIYSTVGTYRQNYFIALLNNIDTATKAINGMGDALGYSMRENETAMEAFSKKWNQLVISAKELAVQFGEMGFLDLMKGAVEATSAILKMTKSVGGLQTVMIGLTAIFATVKRQKIEGYLSKIGDAFTYCKGTALYFQRQLVITGSATKAFSATVAASQITMGGWIAIISLAVTAISAIAGRIKQAREEAEQARQEAIAAGTEAVKKSQELSAAYREYDEARSGGTSDERKNATEQLIQQLGYEISDITILIDRYGSLEDAIESLMDAEYERNKEAAKGAYEAKASEVEFQKVKRQSIEIAKEDIEVLRKLNEAGYDVTNWINALNGAGRDITFAFEIPDFASAQPQLDKYNGMLEVMEGLLTSDEKAQNKLYQSISKARDALATYIREVEDLKAKYEQYGMSREEYDRNMAEAEAKFKSAMEDANSTIETTVMTLEQMDEAIDNLNKKMDGFQSAIKTVHDVVEQYNETGIMTADMLQSLIELAPEYIDLIDINSNSLSVNQEKLESLMKTNDGYMVQLAAMKVQKEFEALSTELQKNEYDNLTEAEIRNMIATQALGGTVYQAAMQLYTGQINAKQFADKIAEAGKQAGLSAEKIAVLSGNMVDLAGSMSGVLDLAGMFSNFTSKFISGKTIEQWDALYRSGKITDTEMQKIYQKYQRGEFDSAKTNTVTPTKSSGLQTWMPSTKKTSSTGGSKTEDPYKEEKEFLKELLEVYEHSIFLIEKNEDVTRESSEKIVDIYRKMQEAVHVQAERYRTDGVDENDSMIRELQEQWWSYQDKIESVMSDIFDEVVKTHQNAIKQLEYQYETAEQNLDYSYMGENLKKQLDYQVKIQREAERELERLAKLGMDANSDAAQDVIDTWYDAEKAIREISQKIASDILDPYDDFIDLADHFELWEYMDFTKVDYLRDKLEAVNQLLRDGTIFLKEYNAQLREISYAIYDAQKELYEQEKQAVSDKTQQIVDAYKADQESLKNQKDQLNDYYDSVIDGYEKEIETWEKRKEEVEDYYDTLIDNLQDVQKANERINKQVDYYNDRQKIITNLEQAQARSGVEWREKEMEYQQQLIDLDEEWRRTQKEWSIEDQITAIEKLKEIAIADIDLSIQKIRDTITATEEAKQSALDAIDEEIEAINDLIASAEEAAESELEVIENKIVDLSRTIADAIKNGTADGLVNSKEELDKALVDGTNEMLEYIDKGKIAMEDSATQTANSVYGIYDSDFLTPMSDKIIDIASTMSTAISEGAEQGAKQALNTFQSSFITPLKQEMSSLMKDIQTANTTISTASTTSTVSAVKKLTTAQVTGLNFGAGPVSSTVPKFTGIKNAAWTLPGFTPVTATKENVKNVYITNNYKSVSEGVRGTQGYLSSLGF